VAIKVRDDCIIGADKDNRAVIKAIVDCVEAKGWDSIKISGNKGLQVMLAAEAMDRGIAVEGFKKPESIDGAKEGKDDDAVSETPQNEPTKPNTDGSEDDAVEDTVEYTKEQESIDQARETEFQEAETQRKERQAAAIEGAESDMKERTEGHEDVAKEAAQRREERQKEATERLKPKASRDREEAYNNLERSEAVELYPELAPVYKLVGEARQFLESNRHRFTDTAAQQFVDSVRTNCFERLDRGENLQPRVAEAKKSRTEEMELELD